MVEMAEEAKGELMKALYFIPIAMIFMSCATTEYEDVSSPPWFPKDTSATKDISENLTSYLGEYLTAFEEPSLYQRALAEHPPETRDFRFLYLRTFHPAIVIRVEIMPDGEGRLIFQQMEGQTGFEIDPSASIEEKRRVLSKTETDALVQAYDTLSICGPGPRTRRLARGDLSISSDGAFWVYERRAGSAYCFNYEHVPKQDDPHELVGRLMLETAGFQETKENPIY